MNESSLNMPLDHSRAAFLLRHARLWRGCFSLALIREAQFRVHFLTTVALGLFQVAIGLIPVLLLFGYTNEIHGWSEADVIVLLGLHQVMTGTLGMFFTRNMWEITEYITRGNLDLLLIRPVNTQFYLSTRWIRPDQAFNVITGLVVAGIGLNRTDSQVSGLDMVQSGILFVAGFLLITCLWSAIAYSAFWMQSVGSITMFVQDLMQAGRYPVSFYPLAMRLMFTFLVPLAFATTFPAQAITGGISWWVVLGAVGFAMLALVLIRLFWLFAVRRYSSASS